MTTIGLLHPGEMGTGIGAALVAGGHELLWASTGRSQATRARAEAAGLRDAGDVASVAAASSLVLSICPPHAAREVAESVAGLTGIFVDANAISPALAAEIAAAVQRRGATYVDAGIIGPPPGPAGTPRLYLSGPGAADVAERLAGTAIDARVVGPDPTAASALKMTYAAWTKGSAALLLAIAAAADELGVGEALAEEWTTSLPDLAARSQRAGADAARKGWRWMAEMEEIARTFGDVGLPSGFHRAAAEIFARTSRGQPDQAPSCATEASPASAERSASHG